MKFTSTKVMLMFTLIGGILISVSSNSWLGVWLGLEVNLLSFIPIMSSTEDVMSTEASMKYFIVQAMASSMLIFMITIMDNAKQLNLNKMSLDTLLNLPLMIKMGSPPFHWWFPSVMEGLQWNNCFILLTMQKIAPLTLISYTLKFNLMSSTIIALSVIVGSAGGYNQTSLRKILTYSSINHLGWMITAAITSKIMLLTYLMIYSTMNLIITKALEMMNSSHINQIYSPDRSNILMKILMMSTLLSLGGLPPMIGFMPKWTMIMNMINNQHLMMITLMVMTSLITLFYYLRLTYATFMINELKVKWTENSMYNSNTKPLHPTTIILMITGMMSLTPIIYFIN